MDSTGLDALVDARDEARAQGGWLRLADVPPHALKLLRITGLDHTFPRYPSVTEAVATANRTRRIHLIPPAPHT